MPNFPNQRFSAVYVIYSADILAASTRYIEEMSPASHLPAGHQGLRKRVREIVASRFVQTEDDGQYDYGYLGKHGGSRSYFPYGTVSADGELPDDDYEGETGEGQHRKWAGELTRSEWLIFADAYLIDLDPAGYPASYEETLGSLTEHGHLEAVSVDNTEGWACGYGSVIDSRMYVSFAYPEDPNQPPETDRPGLTDVDSGAYDPSRFDEIGERPIA